MPNSFPWFDGVMVAPYVFDNVSLVRIENGHVPRQALDPEHLLLMPREGFEDSYSTEPRLGIWHGR